MSWSENWGETFDRAPAWVIAFAEFLSVPKDAREDDCLTQRQFGEKWAVSRTLLSRVQGEPEFKRLRLSMADANGITEAHRAAVMSNLFHQAAYGNDPRAIKLFMEISGQLMPTPSVQIDVSALEDAALDALLAQRLQALPAESAIKELKS